MHAQRRQQHRPIRVDVYGQQLSRQPDDQGRAGQSRPGERHQRADHARDRHLSGAFPVISPGDYAGGARSELREHIFHRRCRHDAERALKETEATMPSIRNSENERGQTLLLACVSMIVLLSMAALAVDVSMFYVARTEAQRAADAAALAGATVFSTSG